MSAINKKVCAAILSAALFISTVLSLSACSKKDDEAMPGANGETPFIGANGNWWIGDTDTGVAARGQNGRDGADGKNGKDGADGLDGSTPKFHYNSTNGNLQVSYDGGASWTNLANIGNMISDGVDGVSITSCNINTNGELLVYYSDGRSENLGVIVAQDGKNGKDGKDGIGIADVAIDSDGGLFVTLSDGTVFPLGNIMGTDGEDGKDGISGKDGQNGTTPQLKIDTDTYEWFVSYDSGASWIALGVSAAGNDGTDGIDGKDGKDGQDGNTPMLRIDGANNWEVSYDDGDSWIPLGVSASGASGTDGRTPELRIVNGMWEVSYDGKVWTSLEVRAEGVDGEDGAAGVGIRNAFINADGHLILLLTSGESIDCGMVSVPSDGAYEGAVNDIYTDALEFYPINGGTEYGVKIGKAIYLEEIIIPATYNGKPVTTILPNAFDVPEGEVSVLASIYIPNSITTIRYNAFFACYSLTEIIIPASVVEIEDNAFNEEQHVIFAIPEDDVAED